MISDLLPLSLRRSGGAFALLSRPALIVLAALAALSPAAAAPTITASKTTDAPGTRKSQGDGITYTVTIANTGDAAATGVVLTDATPANTTLVGGSVRITPIAFDDTYGVLGNTQRIVAAAAGVLTNDIDPDDAGAFAGGRLSVKENSVTRVSGTTTGALSLNADGSFTYTPALGASSGTERFSYIVLDSDNLESATVGYVDFTLSGRVWFVQNGASGDGRSHSPLGSPATASTSANASTDIIYVLSHASALNGAFTLEPGQQLRGQGVALTASLDTNGSTSSVTFFSASTAPTLTNTSGTIVTLSGTTPSNTLSGVTLGNRTAAAISGADFGTLTVTSDVVISGTGPALSLSNGTVNATFASLSASAASFGISLTNVNGSLVVNAGALATLTGDDIAISGGTVAFTYAGTINNASGRSINITNKTTSGNVTFSGAITDTGTGIVLDNNDGATISFTGGLSLSTGTNAAFTATNGGTINVTQNNSTVVNTLTTTTGVPLTVSNTTIGASGLTFRSISSNGAPNGILLLNTGPSGGLTITGTDGGDAGTMADAGTGGAIQNSTGHGISLTNTRSVRLDGMNVTGNLGHGIYGSTVTGFVVEGAAITGNGNDAATDESGVYLAELTGTAAIRSSTISNNHEFEIVVLNSSGTLSNFELTNNTIAANGVAINGHTVSPHGNLVTFQALGSASMTLTATGGTYTGNIDESGGKSVTATGIMADHSGSSGTVVATITNATFTNNNNAVTVSSANGGNLDFDVINVTATGNRSHGLNLFVGASSTGTVTGSFQNNVIGTNGVAGSGSDLGYGIRVQNEGSTSTSNPVTVLISGNTVRELASFSAINVNHGIAAQALTRTMNVTVTNNTIANVTAGRGVVIQQNNSTAPGIVNSSISGNSFSGVSGQAGDQTEIRLRQLTGGTFNLTQASLAALASANGLATTDISISNTITYGAGTPALPLLLAGGPVDAEEGIVSSALADRRVFGPTSSELSVTEEAETPAETTEHDSSLTQSQLDAVVALAIAQWEATGLTPAQAAYLRGLRFEIADLPAWYLGEASGSSIRVDRDAGGRGWFVGGAAASDSTAVTDGRVDLLTAMLHEMGHALGLDDLHSAEDRHDVMYGWLPAGERRLPVAGAASGAVMPGRGVTHFLSAPLTIDTLPAGKSVIVTFQVTIAAQANISSQGTVSGSNFSSVSTDDPNVGGAADVTVTDVNQPPAVSNFSKSGTEDNAVSFAAANFTGNFADPDSGDALASVTIMSLPSSGVLKLGVANVTAGQTIAAASLGTLTYTPSAHVHGSDSFTWTATDNSSASLTAASSATVTVTIAPVGDQPSLSDTTTAEDTLSSDGLALTRNAADGAEITHFKVTAITNGTLYKNNGTTQIANGDFITNAEANAGLKFLPAPNKNSAAGDTFSFEIAGAADSSGTGLGAETTASITVTEVNDAPVPVDDTLSAVDEDSDPVTISFASLTGNDSTGPADESGQSLTITAVENAVGGSVAIEDTNVIFTLAANFAGTASFDYTVGDNGVTNGTADAKTASGSASFTVNAVNDAPTITAPATLSGLPGSPLAITGVTFADIDAGGSAVVASFSAPTGTFAATSGGGVTVSGGGSASVTLTGSIANLNAFIAGSLLSFTGSANTTLTIGLDDEGASGSGGDKTASASIAISLDQPPVAGFGGALLLERTRSEGVQVAHDAALNFGAGSFTVEAWIKRSGSGSGFFTVAGKQATAGGAGWFFRFNDNILSFAAGTNAVDTTATIADSAWHHVAAVHDATAKSVAIYIDGVLSRSASFATASNSDSTQPLGFGFKPNYGEYFDGTLDDVRLWSTARTASQLVEFMRTPLTGAEAGLVGYWSFEGTGTTVANLTANAGLDGAVQNAGGSAERVSGNIGYAVSVLEDSGANALRLGGSDVESPSAVVARITGLPAEGKLYHADGTTQITSASAGSPVAVVDAGGNPRRVVYIPNADYFGSDSFTYIVHDGISSSANTVTVNLTVAGANDAPTAVDDTLSDVAEDSGVRTISFATLVGNDAGGPANENAQSLTVTAVANAVGGSVEISGSNVLFTPTANYHGSAGFDYTLRDNGQTNGVDDFKTDTGAVSFTITPVGDAPAATDASTAEDTQTSSGLVLTRHAADGAEVTHFKITSIANGTLYLANGTTQIANGGFITVAEGGAGLRFTPAANYFGDATFVAQSATDGSGAGLGGSTTVTITVSAVADTPSVTNATTDEDTQSTSGLVLSRHAADGTEVTHFKIAAITQGALYLNNGTTPVADGDFITVAQGGAGLKFTPAANFFGSASFTVQAATDSSGAGISGSATATITVVAVNDAPVVATSLGTTAFTEGNNVSSTPVVIDAGLTVDDVDSASLASATVAITGGFAAAEDGLAFANQNGITGSYDADTGVLTLSGSATKELYQAALRSVTYTNSSDAPSETTRTISFRVNDGALSSSAATKSVSVTAVDDTPVISTSGGTTPFAEGDNVTSTPVVVDAALTVADLDNPTLASASVAITANFLSEDTLAFTNDGATMGNIAATGFSGGVLSLSSAGATATKAQWQAALRAVTYTNSSETPSEATRTISFTANDGNSTSSAATKAVGVAGVNDAPVLGTSGGTVTFTEGNNVTSTPVVIDSGLTVSDVDSDSLSGAFVHFTGNHVADEDVLSFTNNGSTMGNISVQAFNATTGTLTLRSSGNSATIAQWQAALRAVTYTNTSETPNTSTRRIAFEIASDDDLMQVGDTSDVSVVAVNDTPSEIALSASGLNQSQGANAVVGTLSATDLDDNAFTFTLVTGTGDTHNSRFNIAGASLRANTPGTMAAGSYSVRVQVDDGHTGGTLQEVFSITVSDDVAATIQSVAVPAAGIYGVGQALDFTFTFSETVNVVTAGGTPTLELSIGGVSQVATYVSGSGTTTLVFRYVVQAGDYAADGGVVVGALALNGGTIRDAANNNASLAFTAPPLAGVLIEARFHSADTNQDWRLSLLELTRVIELYNTRDGTVRTGEYHTQSGTEDGFAAGAGSLLSPHSGDSNQDGKISLLELTRVIELYNTRDGTTRTGEYHRETGTEDGFASGPVPTP